MTSARGSMERNGAMPSVAITAIARDEADLLAEWIAFHLVQGVARIHVRLDAATTDVSVPLLRLIAARDARVTWAPWDPGERNFDLEQRAVYAEAAATLAGTVTFLACIDIDEFLFPRQHASLPEALAWVPPRVGAIAVGCRVFGSAGRVPRGKGLAIERFLRCADAWHKEGCWFKSIVRPECVTAYDSPHSAELSSGDYVTQHATRLRRPGPHPGCADAPSFGAIGLHHYVIRSREEFEAKQRRWADRRMGGRYREGYFRHFDDFANAAENREALRFAGATRALAKALIA
jgi:Glycosyl transferase family 2